MLMFGQRGGRPARLPAEEAVSVGTESINLLVTEDLWPEIVGD